MEFESVQAAIQYQIEKAREEKELIIKEWFISNLGYMRLQGIEVYNIDDVIARLLKADELEAENERLKLQIIGQGLMQGFKTGIDKED